MQHSESILNVMKKISQLQEKTPKLKKDGFNPFLKNNYVKLAQILRKIKPVIKDLNLSVVQFAYGDGGSGVTTVVCDLDSGEWVSESMAVAPSDAKGVSTGQVAGANVTYFRRYALVCILLADTDDDNDAQIPEQKAEQKKAPQKSDTPIFDQFKKLIKAHAILRGVYKGDGDKVGGKLLKDKVVNPLGAAIDRMEKDGKIDPAIVEQAKKIVDELAPPKA